MKKSAATALLVLFLFTGQGSAENAVPLPEYYSKKNLTGFISLLVSKKSYYRAAHELRRLHAYYPRAFSLQSFIVSEEYFLLRGRQFSAVPEVHNYYGAAISFPSGIFHVDSLLMQGNYIKAEAGILKWTGLKDKELNSFLHKRKIYLSVMRGANGDTENLFKLSESGGLNAYPKLKGEGQTLIESMKSPFFAAALGLVPGMGYVYGGETGTGIASFVVISLCATLSYLGFRYKTPSAGILLGAVATFFYTGSIAGGYRLADRHNELMRRRISTMAADELGIYRDQRRIFERFGVEGI